MMQRMGGQCREGKLMIQRGKDDDAEKGRVCCREDMQRKKDVVAIGKK
jgi:hypothetical protein